MVMILETNANAAILHKPCNSLCGRVILLSRTRRYCYPYTPIIIRYLYTEVFDFWVRLRLLYTIRGGGHRLAKSCKRTTGSRIGQIKENKGLNGGLGLYQKKKIKKFKNYLPLQLLVELNLTREDLGSHSPPLFRHITQQLFTTVENTINIIGIELLLFQLYL